MKTALILLAGLALAGPPLPARAQTDPAVQAHPTKPKPTGAALRKPGAYTGPYVVNDTRKLGQKFIGRSRPGDYPIKTKPRSQSPK